MAIYINPDPINVLNFLRWHEPVAGPFDGLAFSESGECLQVQVPDSRPASACKVLAEPDDEVYAIPARYYDQITFTVNAAKDFGSDLSLFLLQGNALTLITTFSAAYLTVGTNKYLRGSFNVPCAPEGQYNLVLAQGSAPTLPGEPDITGREIIAVSNPIRVINHQSRQHPTVWAEFRHPVSQFGYPYSADDTLINRFRIDALLTKARPAESITTYEDRNHRTRFVGRGSLQRVSDFKTDDVDQATHEAIAAMFLHSELTIDGRGYAKVEAYETELYNDDYPLFQGVAKVKDLDFTTAANTCQTGILTPPEDGPGEPEG